MRRAATYALTAGIAIVAACQSDDGPRYRDRDGQFSMVELDGWTRTHERDSVVFYGSADEGLEQHSIAIRSVPREGDGAVTARTASGVTTATKAAIQGLPGAKLESQVSIAAPGMSGMSFELTFVPRRAKGKRYERTHVVLIGTRVFHILHTAPEGTLGQTGYLFEQVVDSFREEL